MVLVMSQLKTASLRKVFGENLLCGVCDIILYLVAWNSKLTTGIFHTFKGENMLTRPGAKRLVPVVRNLKGGSIGTATLPKWFSEKRTNPVVNDQKRCEWTTLLVDEWYLYWLWASRKLHACQGPNLVKTARIQS